MYLNYLYGLYELKIMNSLLFFTWNEGGVNLDQSEVAKIDRAGN